MSDDTRPPLNEVGAAVEGGEVKLEGTLLVRDQIAKAKADTSRYLAYILVITLAVSVIAHYVAVVILVSNGNSAAVDRLDAIFNAWLPVISGLTGSAIAFFFSKERA